MIRRPYCASTCKGKNGLPKISRNAYLHKRFSKLLRWGAEKLTENNTDHVKCKLKYLQNTKTYDMNFSFKPISFSHHVWSQVFTVSSSTKSILSCKEKLEKGYQEIFQEKLLNQESECWNELFSPEWLLTHNFMKVLITIIWWPVH